MIFRGRPCVRAGDNVIIGGVNLQDADETAYRGFKIYTRLVNKLQPKNLQLLIIHNTEKSRETRQRNNITQIFARTT